MSMPPVFYQEYVAEESRQSRKSATAENSARRARSSHMLQATGVGQVRIAEPLRFVVRFLQEPFFTCGVGVITQPDPAVYQDPMGNAMVTSWLRNEEGHYLGAYVTLRNELWTPFGYIQNTALPPGSTPVSLVHYMVFEGLAYKHVGDGVVAVASSNLPPRAVGFGGIT